MSGYWLKFPLIGVGCCWYLVVVTELDLNWFNGLFSPLFLRFSLVIGAFSRSIHMYSIAFAPRCRRLLESCNMTVWIVLRYGSRSWPVCVVDNVMGWGWSKLCAEHQLGNGYKLILSCTDVMFAFYI